MGKELHIFRYYWGGMLFNRALSRQKKKSTEYLWFPLDFADLYLPKDNSKEEIIKAVYSRRIRDYEFLEFKDYNVSNFSHRYNALDYMEAFASLDFSQYDRVYYWLEKESRSYLAYCYLSTFINNENLYEIPVELFHPEIKEVATFSHVSGEDFNGKWESLRQRSVLLDDAKRESLANDWKYWMNATDDFRVFEGGRITGKRIDFLDDFIKNAVKEKSSWFGVISLVDKLQPYKELDGINGWGFISERMLVLCETQEIQAELSPDTRLNQ